MSANHLPPGAGPSARQARRPSSISLIARCVRHARAARWRGKKLNQLPQG